MKKIILKFMMVFPIILLGSCKKFLETEPIDFFAPQTYYQTEEQLEFALAGVYDRLGVNRLYSAYIPTRYHFEADEGFFNLESQVIGTSVHNFLANDPDVRLFWRELYSGVGRANALLANVNSNIEIDEAIRNRIRGEALFLRAYYYFLLVQNFEDVPVYLEPISNHKQVDIPATPAKELYEQIIADMEEAESLVDPIEQIGFGGRVSKSAVRGILARVCLNMAGKPVEDISQYEKASYWAKKVIEDIGAGHELNPDYSDIFIKYARDEYDIKESIWEVEFWGANTDAYQEGGYLGSWNGIRNINNNDVGYSFGRIVGTGKHYRLYETGDLRRDWNLAPFSYRADGSKNPRPEDPLPSQQYDRYSGKFRREYQTLLPKSGQPTPINFPLLRYADVLLMFAEAENEIHQGPTTEALEALNLVRRRGFGHLMPGATGPVDANDLPTGMSQSKFLNAIMDERSRELCYEGMRKADLVRWGLYLTTMKETLEKFNTDLGPTAWQSLSFRNVSQKHVVYPIPSYELELNKALVQHRLWK